MQSHPRPDGPVTSDGPPAWETVQLGEQQCLDRLAGVRVGYLATTARALPFVTPVAVAATGPDLLVEPLAAEAPELRLDAVVALAVGSLSGDSPWSVLAQGVLRAPGPTLAGQAGPHGRYLLHAEVVSGWRRVPAGEPSHP